jgi:hypothetical protein
MARIRVISTSLRWGRRFHLSTRLRLADPGVGVEFDGWTTHGTYEAFQDDRARDRRLQIRLWRVLHDTAEDVRCRPDEVLAEIGEAVSVKGGSRPFLTETAPRTSSSPENWFPAVSPGARTTVTPGLGQRTRRVRGGLCR